MTTTADRVLSVLRLFTVAEAEWTVEDAATRLGLAVSTAYRYFRSLTEAGLIVKFAAGRYVIGPAIIEFDRQIRQRPLIRAAEPAVAVLSEVEVDAVVLLCRVYRLTVMCVDQMIVGSPRTSVSYERGRPMPLFRGAASKAILAHLPARTIRRIYPAEAAAVGAGGLGSSWEELKARMKAIRNAGVAVTHGELDAGVIGISAPVFDPDGDILGSIGLVLAEGDGRHEDRQLQDAVRAAAAAAATRTLAEQARVLAPARPSAAGRAVAASARGPTSSVKPSNRAPRRAAAFD